MSHVAPPPSAARFCHQLPPQISPPGGDTCEAPVCTPDTDTHACALANLSLVAPLDLKAAFEQALAAEMSKAGLLMLRRAGDLIRIAREWEDVESAMVDMADVEVSNASVAGTRRI